jgi:hypothetical protein
MVNEYAMGIMLKYTEDKYKNDETLLDITNKLINFYNKIHDSELNKYYFYSMFYNHHQYSQYLKLNKREKENIFMTMMKDLILSIKNEDIKDFDEWINLEDVREYDLWDSFPASIYSFFINSNRKVKKSSNICFLDRMYTDLNNEENYNFMIRFDIFEKLYNIKKIYIEKENDLDQNIIDLTSLKSIVDIKNIFNDLKKDEIIHFIFLNDEEIIFYKSNNNIQYYYSKSIFNTVLPYIFNTKNDLLMSKYIDIIDSKILRDLKEKDKIKINRYIDYTNKQNEILFKREFPKDIIKHIINKMIYKDDIDYVCVYEAKDVLKKINQLIENFIEKENYSETNLELLVRMIKVVIKSLKEIDSIFYNEKYESIKKEIIINIKINLYKLYLTKIAEKLFKMQNDLLKINIENAIELKSNIDDNNFHNIIDLFLIKYNPF